LEAVDVVIIGAGVAGLSCARALVQQGRAVVVVEARDRIGGRIWTLRLPGQPPVELGAQVIHGAQASTFSVVREAHLPTAPATGEGEMVFRVDGQLHSVPEMMRAGIPPWAIEQLLCRAEPQDQPVGAVLDRLGVRGLSRTLGVEWLAQTWCADPAELSAAGIWQFKGAAQSGVGEFMIIEGYDQVPQYLAQGLTVQLGTPVERVRWEPGRVEVAAGPACWQAQAAVITVPPTVVAAGGLLFDPPLPPEKEAAARALLLGDALVVVAQLVEPAPRTGWAFVAGEAGGFWRSKAGSPLLIGWMRGPAGAGGARELAARGELVTRLACSLFPWLRPAMVASLQIVDWGADPYSRGGYSYPRVQALQQPRAWATPLHGTLFFAGEATCADRHLGLVDGALESGLRAAHEFAELRS
jgi:monoamine oxidase